MGGTACARKDREDPPQLDDRSVPLMVTSVAPARHTRAMTSRREFLEIVGGAVAGAVLVSAVADAAPKAQPPAKLPAAGVAPGAHSVRDLPFQPAKLTGLSAAMIASHHATSLVPEGQVPCQAFCPPEGYKIPLCSRGQK